jgi:hypothetical protein
MECLTNLQSDEDDVDFPMFRVAGDTCLEIPAIGGSKHHWIVPVVPESEGHLFKRWGRRMKSPLGVGHRHELKVNDKIFLQYRRTLVTGNI